MQEKALKALIEKCLSGKATAQEQKLLDDWYETFENQKGLTEQLSEQEVKGTAERMLLEISSSLEQKRPSQKTFVRRMILAAASVMLIAGSWWIYQSAGKMAKTPAIVWAILKAPSNKILKQQLPDGSLVWMNAGSTIRYPQNFISKQRELWLDGEAYFEVVRQPEHPFSVHTGDVITKVLGTKFNVAATARGVQVVVTVSEGKVSVGRERKVIRILKKDDQLLVDAANGHNSFSHVTPATFTSWKNDALAFKEKPFKEIASVLEQRFGVNIRFSNPGIEECLLTASFSKDRNVEDILAILCKVNGFQLQSGKKWYIIAGKPCKN